MVIKVTKISLLIQYDHLTEHCSGQYDKLSDSLPDHASFLLYFVMRSYHTSELFHFISRGFTIKHNTISIIPQHIF